jgi:tRNA pseudouridine55 synthase
VVAKLGESTDTGDADGTITGNAAVPDIDERRWREVFAAFEGEIMQVPPMYSALKQDGKRLYELARQGIEVERKARKVRIYALDLLEASGSRLAFRVRCSKGTYVRTLVEDLARQVGTIAHTVTLHREAVAGFAASQMRGFDALETLDEAGLQACLLPVDQALQHWPACRLTEAEAMLFMQGQAVAASDSGPRAGDLLRAYGAQGTFLGIAMATGDGRLAPKRLFHLPL